MKHPLTDAASPMDSHLSEQQGWHYHHKFGRQSFGCEQLKSEHCGELRAAKKQES